MSEPGGTCACCTQGIPARILAYCCFFDVKTSLQLLQYTSADSVERRRVVRHLAVLNQVAIAN